MTAFEYERDDYQAYLKGLEKDGTYQDYENAVYEMNQLKNELKKDIENLPHVDDIVCLIDQVDKTYYGDIGFHTDVPLDKFDVFFVAGALCAAIREQGEDCQSYCLYYNKPMQMFMYTNICIHAEDGPNLYAEGTRNFIVR